MILCAFHYKVPLLHFNQIKKCHLPIAILTELNKRSLRRKQYCYSKVAPLLHLNSFYVIKKRKGQLKLLCSELNWSIWLAPQFHFHSLHPIRVKLHAYRIMAIILIHFEKVSVFCTILQAFLEAGQNLQRGIDSTYVRNQWLTCHQK